MNFVPFLLNEYRFWISHRAIWGPVKITHWINFLFFYIHSFVQSPSLDTLRANRINLSSHFTFLNYDGQRSQWWIYMKHKLYNDLNYMLIVRLAHAFHHHQHHNCIYLIWMFLLPLFIALHCMHFFLFFSSSSSPSLWYLVCISVLSPQFIPLLI